MCVGGRYPGPPSFHHPHPHFYPLLWQVVAVRCLPNVKGLGEASKARKAAGDRPAFVSPERQSMLSPPSLSCARQELLCEPPGSRWAGGTSFTYLPTSGTDWPAPELLSADTSALTQGPFSLPVSEAMSSLPAATAGCLPGLSLLWWPWLLWWTLDSGPPTCDCFCSWAPGRFCCMLPLKMGPARAL